MPEPRSRDEMRRQVLQHLESLRAAGVEWLPAAHLPSRESAAAPQADPLPPDHKDQAVMTNATGSDLFGGAPTPRLSTASVAERRQELQLLATRVASCTRCPELAATRTQTVFGVGQIQPDVCFVGEAPGADEDAQGEPFVGAAGQLLNRIIAACGMKREEVYICNILKCRPPGNRLPLPVEAGHCREYLERQLDLIQPRFICALGACAAQNLLNTTTSIGRLRGQFHDYRGIPVMCTYHPAYLLRSPDKKKDVWEDMKKLMARLGRPVK